MQWPWARRKSIWDPPTILDNLLSSPLQLLVQSIYHILLFLRGPSFKPPQNKPPIRVVCISDTHCHQPTTPTGDLLIHAGDLTNEGTVEEIQAQIDWLASLPHKYKVIICGNHDSYFDPKTRKDVDKKSGAKLNFRGVYYLYNQSLYAKFKGGRTLNIYGAGDIPDCKNPDFAYQYSPTNPPWPNRIPIQTDVLITHIPPKSHLDINSGCPSLLSEIWHVKPRLHVFGHLHSGRGQEFVFWDEGQRAYERIMAAPNNGILGELVPSTAWLDVLKVVWYGVRGILWQWLMVGPKGANGGVLVNPAIVWQSTLDARNEAIVVDL